MPTFDFVCKGCGCVQEVLCSYKASVESPPVHCGMVMQRVFSTRVQFSNRLNGTIFPPNGVTIEHLPGGPKHFNSLSEMNKYEKAHDLQIGG
jgi:hypothetical protein